MRLELDTPLTWSSIFKERDPSVWEASWIINTICFRIKEMAGGTNSSLILKEGWDPHKNLLELFNQPFCLIISSGKIPILLRPTNDFSMTLRTEL